MADSHSIRKKLRKGWSAPSESTEIYKNGCYTICNDQIVLARFDIDFPYIERFFRAEPHLRSVLLKYILILSNFA